MSVAAEMADQIIFLRREINTLRRESRDQAALIETNTATISRSLLAGAGDSRPLSPGHGTVFLMITSLISANRWNAVRMQIGVSGYEADDEDTDPYIVVPSPGNTGLFIGARGLATLREIESGPPQAGVYEMVKGECRGFFGKITGAPTKVSANEHTYPWSQTGLVAGDIYTSDTIQGGNPLGEALQLSSLAYDPLITLCDDLPIDTPIFLWRDVDGNRFVFEVCNDRIAQGTF